MPASHQSSRPSSEPLHNQDITSDYNDHRGPDSTSSDPTRARSLPASRLSASFSVLVETEPHRLIPDSDGEILSEESQQPQDIEGEGKDSGCGNSLQHQDDIPRSLTTLGGPGNAVSIIEDEGTQSANRITVGFFVAVTSCGFNCTILVALLSQEISRSNVFLHTNLDCLSCLSTFTHFGR